MGNGTPGSCTDDTFGTALASSSLVTFNCGAPPTSGGFNLATDTACNPSPGLNDQSGVTSGLGPLTSDPLVFTKYHQPQSDSLLANHGGPGCSVTDQRYALRPDACDTGAIEFGGLLPRIFAPRIRK